VSSGLPNGVRGGIGWEGAVVTGAATLAGRSFKANRPSAIDA